GVDSEEETEKNKDKEKVNTIIERQTQVLRSIWKRQLSCPHSGIKNTYAQYQVFEENLTDKQASTFKPQYLKSKRLIKQMEMFESELEELPKPCLFVCLFASPGCANTERYEEWNEYISTMRKFEDQKLSLVQNLFERALLDCYCYEQFWYVLLNYAQWLEEKNMKTELIELLEKSVRVFPHSSYLVCALIRAYEFNGTANTAMEKFFQRIAFPDQSKPTSNQV
ncbi:hypothetical protein RFI_19365, partial [Reticulomyxa filosa]